MRLVYAILFALISTAASAAPTAYYVDTVNGNNGNAGTSSGAAWATLKHAIETGITPDTTNGDIIYIYAPVGTPDVYSTGDPAIDITAYAATATGAAPLIVRGQNSAFNADATAYITCTGRFFINDSAFDHLRLIGLDVTGGSAVGLYQSDRNTVLLNCAFHQTSSGYNSIVDGVNSYVVNCEFDGAGSNADLLTCIGGGVIAGCFFHEETNASEGVNGGQFIVNNIMRLNSTDTAAGMVGINSGGLVVGNTVYNAAAGTGVGILVTGAESLVANNYVEGFSGTGGIAYQNTDGTEYAYVQIGNLHFNNETAVSVSGPGFMFDDTTATSASGLTAPGSDNFTPTSELKDAGTPSTFLGSTQDSNINVGAVQDTASGGGSVALPPIKLPQQ